MLICLMIFYSKNLVPFQHFDHVFFRVPPHGQVRKLLVGLGDCPLLVFDEAILQGDGALWAVPQEHGHDLESWIQWLPLQRSYLATIYVVSFWMGLVKVARLKFPGHGQMVSISPLIMQPLWHIESTIFLGFAQSAQLRFECVVFLISHGHKNQKGLIGIGNANPLK